MQEQLLHQPLSAIHSFKPESTSSQLQKPAHQLHLAQKNPNTSQRSRLHIDFASPLDNLRENSRLSKTTTTAQTAATSSTWLPKPRNVQIRPSMCGEFMIVAEEYAIPLTRPEKGFLPMDRRCTLPVYERAYLANAAILLVHGFCSNKAMFEAGGGKGKQGSSFFEFLAQRGYDTYAVDLRGTRAATALGAQSPAFITEHIEFDVPAAIAAIKRMGHEKVYLIGHSMGGAISCAVAGYIPDDVAGVVHLAGLYQFTPPIIGDLRDFYRATCPPALQSLFAAGTTFGIRSLYSVLSPPLNIASRVVSTLNSSLSIKAGSNHSETDKKSSISVYCPTTRSLVSRRGVVASAQYVAAYIRRQHLPIRSIVDGLLFARKFVPDIVSKVIMNVLLYPSPWLPYSIEHPASFIDMTLESPTIGIVISVGTSSLHKDIFNQWLEGSSIHRAEIPATGAKISNDNHGSSKKLHAGDPQYNELSTNKRQKNSIDVDDSINEDNSMESNSAMNEPKPSSTIIEITSAEISPSPESLSFRPILTRAQHEADRQIKRRATQEATKTATATYSLHHNWNELGPYLEQFERLEHMPLFFCPANADRILRNEDSMAGFLHSKSKWKETIEYRDVKPRENGDGGVTSKSTVNGVERSDISVADIRSKLPRMSLTITEIEQNNRDEPRKSENIKSGSNNTSISQNSNERLKRVSSGSSFAKSRLYNPTLSTNIPGGGVLRSAMGSDRTKNMNDGDSNNEKKYIKNNGSNVAFVIEDDYEINNMIKPRYSVPSSLRVGHCDILGGKDSELVWHRIVDCSATTFSRQPAAPQLISEVDILRTNHRFLRDGEADNIESSSDPQQQRSSSGNDTSGSNDESFLTWEQRIAKKYYDKLFKEFAVANLERYKEGKVALRWRTRREVVAGIGQFTCANMKCQHRAPYMPAALPILNSSSITIHHHQPDLRSWEVNFAYKEDNEHKNALVKIRLCLECSYFLNYKKNLEKREAEETAAKERLRKRKSIKKEKKYKKRKSGVLKNDSNTTDDVSSQEESSDANEELEETPAENVYEPKQSLASQIWGAPQVLETEKSKDEEMDDFFDEIFD
ncbi:hypothetical protein HK100_006921 [Physocladia obscura]|uniref:AB hydrolase-1 domain-containing protein n=1 Tax=Physocladia obscura TaxID=109957 RepID=A0AAD5T5Q5_9FUNG|nr:hypothetical protein HK100_006921 [Physocladia obscura]